MNIIKKGFTRHIRKGRLPYAFAYMKTLQTLIKVGVISACCWDLAQREVSHDQIVLFIIAAISCILLAAQIHSNYTELKQKFLKHELLRKFRKNNTCVAQNN